MSGFLLGLKPLITKTFHKYKADLMLAGGIQTDDSVGSQKKNQH